MKRLLACMFLALCVVALAQERFDKKVRSYFFAGYTGDKDARAHHVELVRLLPSGCVSK